MDYSAKDMPVTMHHEDLLTFSDGTSLRFETNGEAKDIYVGGAFEPNIQLFPDNIFSFPADGRDVNVRALFEDKILVEYA